MGLALRCRLFDVRPLEVFNQFFAMTMARKDSSFSKTFSSGPPKSSAMMNKTKSFIVEKEGDLFAASKSTSLAHCVSSDLKMGAGIAVHFKKKFGGVEHLLKQKKTVGEVAYLKDGQRYIFYLVTKERYFDKPTELTLKHSLLDMKYKCQELGVKHLAMPRVGCGLDGLNWSSVFRMLREMFSNSDIDVTIYSIPDSKIRTLTPVMSSRQGSIRDFLQSKSLSSLDMTSKRKRYHDSSEEERETPKKRRVTEKASTLKKPTHSVRDSDESSSASDQELQKKKQVNPVIKPLKSSSSLTSQECIPFLNERSKSPSSTDNDHLKDKKHPHPQKVKKDSGTRERSLSPCRKKERSQTKYSESKSIVSSSGMLSKQLSTHRKSGVSMSSEKDLVTGKIKASTPQLSRKKPLQETTSEISSSADEEEHENKPKKVISSVVSTGHQAQPLARTEKFPPDDPILVKRPSKLVATSPAKRRFLVETLSSSDEEESNKSRKTSTVTARRSYHSSTSRLNSPSSGFKKSSFSSVQEEDPSLTTDQEDNRSPVAVYEHQEVRILPTRFRSIEKHSSDSLKVRKPFGTSSYLGSKLLTDRFTELSSPHNESNESFSSAENKNGLELPIDSNEEDLDDESPIQSLRKNKIRSQRDEIEVFSQSRLKSNQHSSLYQEISETDCMENDLRTSRQSKYFLSSSSSDSPQKQGLSGKLKRRLGEFIDETRCDQEKSLGSKRKSQNEYPSLNVKKTKRFTLPSHGTMYCDRVSVSAKSRLSLGHRT